MHSIRSRNDSIRPFGPWGRRVSMALVVVLVLSLLPLPLLAPAGVRAQEEAAIIPPPAKAVQLLERLRASGELEQAAQVSAGRKGRSGQAKTQTIKRKGCTFRQRGKTWTLVRTCTPRGTIVIPNGFTLNGRNRTMIVTGKVRKFDGAVVVAGFGRANIRNLRIIGNAKLTGGCGEIGAGILFFYTHGTINNVTIRGIEPAPGCFNSTGIYAIGDKRVNIVNSTLQSTGSGGIVFQGGVGGRITGNDVQLAARQTIGVTTGIQIGATANIVINNNTFRPLGANQTNGILAFDNTNLNIVGNQFQNLFTGIQASSGATGMPTSTVIRDNRMTDVVSGIQASGGSILVLRNTIIGPATRGTDGLSFFPGAAGQVNSNVITNFACGVLNHAGPGVTLGAGSQANAFSNNTNNVCPPPP